MQAFDLEHQRTGKPHAAYTVRLSTLGEKQCQREYVPRIEVIDTRTR